MMYAWQVYEQGEWNIIGMVLPGGMDPVPMVTTRRHVADSMQAIAFQHAERTGLMVRLVEYEHPRVLEEYEV